MTPGTNVGAATPVQIGGGSPFSPSEEKEGEQKDEASKAEQPKSPSEATAINDAVAYIRSLAELRGRNAASPAASVRTCASLPDHAAHEQGVHYLVARAMDARLPQRRIDMTTK